ncbi:MAG: DNA-directed RNA polymerase subunit D [Candidatus Woesearchaeota archaeon]
MEISFLGKDEKHNRVSFILKGADPTIANTIRKNIIESVPTMAIDDVEFRKNSSALYDEIIAHRLGLIPIKTDLKSYDLKQGCKCKGEGCARCSVKMTLSEKGPGIVYASSIKSKDSQIKPIFPKTPIVKLIKNQELEFEATAVLGIGKDHTKWSPGLAYYKYLPIIEIKGNIGDPEKICEICPVDVYEVKNSKLVVNKDKINDCHLCGACVDIEPNISINESDKDFVFYVESWGQLSNKDIVVKALELMDEKLDEFDKLLK